MSRDDPISTSRRGFLKSGAAVGGGLVIAFVIPGLGKLASARLADDVPMDGAPANAAFAPNAFLRIGTDDRVTVVLAHVEMGQGIATTLAMLIAEELDADWTTIRFEHAPAAPAYFHTAFGRTQLTAGSSSTWSEMDRYRQAGAMARALLVQAATARLGVPSAQLRTRNGAVVAGTRRIRYGELAADAAKLKAPDPDALVLKQPGDWQVIGKPTRRLDSMEKITGRAQFGMDVQFSGLLTAVVARAPVFGGSVKSFNADAAKAVPGVRHVVQVPSGVAVVADHYWAANVGRDALRIDWEPGPHAAAHDDERLRTELDQLAATPGLPAAQTGDVVAALAGAARTIEAIYAVPYLAHAPMEPLNCTVRIGKDHCDIWTGTQSPTAAQGAAAKAAGFQPEQVRVHTMFLGGGFGRRGADHVVEAVNVARAVQAPVKTVWSREDDIRGGYYRPAYVHHARIGLGTDGRPVAWQHVVAGQSIRAGMPSAAPTNDRIDRTSVEGIADSVYLAGVPAHRVGLHSPATGIPVRFWRSVGHSHTAFVMESLIDELAHATGQDSLEYRRLLLKDHPRHLGVLELAAARSGWNTPLAAGRARGVAVHESFGSCVAQVAEVSVDRGLIRVHRVTCAIDCGIAVNPMGIVAQMESGIAFGLGAALHGALSFKSGRVQESNFHDYRVLRLNEMPRVDVHIVPTMEKPGGVGEPGTPPVAPAVANALFALTGQRLRELPFRLA